MRQVKIGIPMKLHKSLFSTIPNSCSGSVLETSHFIVSLSPQDHMCVKLPCNQNDLIFSIFSRYYTVLSVFCVFLPTCICLWIFVIIPWRKQFATFGLPCMFFKTSSSSVNSAQNNSRPTIEGEHAENFLFKESINLIEFCSKQRYHNLYFIVLVFLYH